MLRHSAACSRIITLDRLNETSRAAWSSDGSILVDYPSCSIPRLIALDGPYGDSIVLDGLLGR